MTQQASQQLTLALSKGRIFEETLPLLEAAGIVVTEDPETSRKLILQTNDPAVRVIIVRASDVPTYVQYGAADFGVAGKDVLLEHGGEGLYQPIDLHIAKCRLSVAVQEGFDYAHAVRHGARLRVVTKYVKTAREHFAAKGVHVDLIKLYGSMELAPLIGLADKIIDVVDTGNTLRANGLKVLADGLILKSQAQLAASLIAPWTPSQLASVRRLMGAVEARARALKLSMLTWPADQTARAQAATEAFLERGATRRADGLLAQAGDLLDVAGALAAAGVGPVSVAHPEFAFEPTSAAVEDLTGRLGL